MKKTSIISIIIFIVTIVSFALINANNTQATKINKKSPQTVVVEFTVTGCDNCNIGYCINGGELHTVSSCQFKEVLEPGTYAICLSCSYNKICTQSFVVSDDGSETQYITLTVRPRNGEACACSSSKKK